MCKIVCMYNNKGGVSKTTTLFNLGVLLSKNNKKILFVDCDPQCNLTELFLASYPDIENPERDLPGTSIYQALLPRFRGEVGSVDPSKIELVESSLYKDLHLFRGDLEFSFAETYFGTAWNQAVTENIHEKNTYVSLYRLLQGIGGIKGFDYILCDVGPSTGAITRSVVLACDGIFLPLVPDRFCSQAVRLLGKVIYDWTQKHEQITKSLTPFRIEGFPGKPLLFGAIIQNFKVHSGSKIKQSYLKWQEKISNDIKTHLTGDTGLAIASNLNVNFPYVATIRDVGPLAPTAQLVGRAIFDIRQEDTKEASANGQMYYGTVWNPWVEKMNDYKDEISKIMAVMP